MSTEDVELADTNPAPDQSSAAAKDIDEDEAAPQYALSVDPNQDDKASELKICSFARPHMRAFHYSWWGFFVAFFIWFAIAPLLPQIQKDLELTPQDIWTTNIFAVLGDIFMRFVFGALCDKYGARILSKLYMVVCRCICVVCYLYFVTIIYYNN